MIEIKFAWLTLIVFVVVELYLIFTDGDDYEI